MQVLTPWALEAIAGGRTRREVLAYIVLVTWDLASPAAAIKPAKGTEKSAWMKQRVARWHPTRRKMMET